MRFIADEGVDKAIVEALRGNGRDVRWVAEELPGAQDDAILDAAASRAAPQPKELQARISFDITPERFLP
jgi:hypothetical protein